MKLNTSVLARKIRLNFTKPLYLLLAILLLCSHDLYLKMETYFLQPEQEATLSLYNGTFERSENTITRDRMSDASIVARGERVAIDPDQWQDQDSTITRLTFTPGEAGTYVAGVSTKARNIELSADDFNSYLEHDGVSDMLKYRTDNGLLDEDAVESYQKHVKAIYQVGAVKTDDWNTALGYPIEFVPQANPYEKYSGDQLEVQLLLDGKPLPNQLVYADYIKSANAHTHSDPGQEHEHDGEAHSHETAQSDGEHEHDGETHSHETAQSTGEHEHDGETHSHDHPHDDDAHEHDGEAHSHDHPDDGDAHEHAPEAQAGEAHTHTSGQQLRTNDQGIVAVELPGDGIYYLRTIHMVNVMDSDELTHQSKWATLTFEVTHNHDSSTHTHEEHEHEAGIPTWVFILGSLLTIGLLFFVFSKKNS
ncbi:DUF4198 domain-containing protein [Flavilitoribacter nigricans]|uniref:NikM domain containing protein n=1 Tax=Flavilitoribacter nigricans (strain ATCC 23147 / DSM 23189 / NBRC 102662 / NCIMB 1420 / SS-2) TaxID=1122177 RepID=A0A2D0NES7_FLAN2|nr:DUF4198 domain-containing protein [Flavilitoribacter nigricans]PHN06985.1 NikM domain containing protein [Flavilitoribacter nigricans DSM 23189 = NBRC 102662]